MPFNMVTRRGMKEIKFRAWYKITKEMEYLKDTSWSYWGNCILDNSDADGKDTGNYKIMQYTGLKDKNGKEIYEGDIVRIGEGKFDSCGVHLIGGDGIHVVKYDEKRGCFTNTHTLNGLGKIFNNIEIIGNIHENPELLKG